MTATNANVAVVGNVADPMIVELLNADELRDLLLAQKGAAFLSFDADYNMLEVNAKGALTKMLKTGNPFLGGVLRKIATTNVLANFDYGDALERRTDGAETAADNGKTWQQRIVLNGKPTPLTVHKDDVLEYDGDGNTVKIRPGARAYLNSEFRSSEYRYIDGDGNEVNKSAVAPYLPKRSERGAVKWHTVNLSNVTEMRMNGMTYRIRR